MRYLEQLAGEAIGNITARMYANFANRVEKCYLSVRHATRGFEKAIDYSSLEIFKTSNFHCQNKCLLSLINDYCTCILSYFQGINIYML